MTTSSHNHEPKENEGVDDSRPAFFASTVAKLARLEIVTAVVAILLVGALGYAGGAPAPPPCYRRDRVSYWHSCEVASGARPARPQSSGVDCLFVHRSHRRNRSVRLSTDRFCPAGAFSRYLRFDRDRRLPIVRVGGAGANAPVQRRLVVRRFTRLRKNLVTGFRLRV